MRIAIICFLISFFVPAFAQFGNFQSTDSHSKYVSIETDLGEVQFRSFSPTITQVKFVRKNAVNKQLSNSVIIDAEKNKLTSQHTTDEVIVYRENKPFVKFNKAEQILQFALPGEDLKISTFTAKEVVGFRFPLSTEEEIYGAGERAISMNRRGHKLTLYNQPSYGYGVGATALNYSLPIISSNRNYLLFFDHPQKGYFDVGATNTNEFEFGVTSGELNFYFITGTSQVDLSQQLSQLTGSQPIPPRWAFGHLQSRFGYRTQQEVETIVENTLAAKIPLDATILDLFWFGNGEPGDWQMGDLDWHTERFQEPEQMISNFKTKGVKTILITEPFITNQSFNYEEAIQQDILAKDSTGNDYKLTEFYFGNGGLIDIFKPNAQQWVWEKYKTQIDKGVAGWWVDLAEPEHHPSDVVHVNGTADEVHNIYGHYWDKLLFDQYRTEYPNQRLFNLNRSGYAGSGRYGVFPWTGDVGRNWSGLEAQIPLLLSMNMHGLPYIHSDAGGFAGGEKDAELYTRWMQFAAFTPIFRPHGAVASPESGDEVIEPEVIFWEKETQRIVKQAIELRYQLLPYFYQLAYEHWQKGTPMLLPVLENNSIVEQQYLLGENILVAPIVKPNVTTRSVYLPAGQWFSSTENKYYDGNQWISVPVTLQAIPILYKAGSIIPMKPVFQTTENYPTEFIFHIFPSENKFALNLFNDDGSTPYSIGEGEFEIIQVKVSPKANKNVLIELTNKGTFSGKAFEKDVQFVLHNQLQAPKKVMVNQKSVQFEYDREKAELVISIPKWKHTMQTINIVF